jgi:hypothetical protein
MRVYIGGPMTGYPHFNFPAFDAKRDELRAAGHLPISPADLDRAIGFDPADAHAVQNIPIDREFMKFAVQRDVDALLQCDAIVLLPGWEKSRGARGERTIAEWIGLKIFEPGDPLPVVQAEQVAA